MPIDDLQLRKYLLGSTAGPDEEEISLRLIRDGDLAERLDLAENDLVEDYLDGLLSAEEEMLFRESFLISPERNDLVREVRLLRDGVRGFQTAQTAAETAVSDMPKRSFLSFFSRPLTAAAGLILVLFAGFFAWYTLFRDARTPLELEYASLNRNSIGDPAKTGAFYAISLIPANFRNDASTARHPASKLTDTVVFRLGLMTAEPEGAEREVTVSRSGKRIFTAPSRVFRNPYGSELQVLIPKNVLAPGNYEIEADSPAGRAATYQLRIE